MNLDSNDVARILPHRPPILMIERLTDVTAKVKGTGWRHFREGDPCFEGHFPGNPILPGVLATEAFAQTAMATFLADSLNDTGIENLGVLARIDHMQFLEMITPGMEVAFQINVDRHVGPFAFISCEGLFQGRTVVKGKLSLRILS
jgi:3-hydroxyacyl-[acyl-carrier-protein] dehydratase